MYLYICIYCQQDKTVVYLYILIYYNKINTYVYIYICTQMINKINSYIKFKYIYMPINAHIYIYIYGFTSKHLQLLLCGIVYP